MDFIEERETAWPVQSESNRELDVRPPVSLILFGLVQVVALVVLLVPDTQTLHWIGYVIGAVLVPTTISTFRSVDRTRQRSRFYSSPAWVGYYPSAILIVGVALSVVHAYFLALDTRLA